MLRFHCYEQRLVVLPANRNSQTRKAILLHSYTATIVIAR
jgi:hypothetical protein